MFEKAIFLPVPATSTVPIRIRDFLPSTAIYADDVAVHGSPIRVADRRDAEAPARSFLWLRK